MTSTTKTLTCIAIALLFSSCARLSYVRVKDNTYLAYSPRHIRKILPDFTKDIVRTGKVGVKANDPINVNGGDSLSIKTVLLQQPANQRNITFETALKTYFLIYNGSPSAAARGEILQKIDAVVTKDFNYREKIISGNVELGRVYSAALSATKDSVAQKKIVEAIADLVQKNEVSTLYKYQSKKIELDSIQSDLVKQIDRSKSKKESKEAVNEAFEEIEQKAILSE